MDSWPSITKINEKKKTLEADEKQVRFNEAEIILYLGGHSS